jgi:hypothetical protein
MVDEDAPQVTFVEETKRVKLTDKAIGKDGERVIGP